MISCLGTEPDAQWQALCRATSGIGPLTRFDMDDNFPVRIAGQVPDFDPGPYAFLSPRQMANWHSPVFRHALFVVYRALENSCLEITKDLAPRTAVTFSSAVGGQDSVLAADRRIQKENKLPHPYTNPNSCINMVTGKVAMLTGATGPIMSTITACATGSASIVTGAMLIDSGRADVAICGAVDFALVKPIVAGFATMNGAFRHKSGDDGFDPAQASRPFARGRRGFVISEGAAAVILASREFADANGLGSGVCLKGWSMTADAHHFVAPHEPTVRRCMAQSIDDAEISPADIDSINAHAPSTRTGDAVEYQAIRGVFGKNPPPVTANKSMTGHAMGASSAMESVLAIRSMRENMLLPTINYQPDPEMPMDEVATHTRRLEQEFVLKNAFGFGGCNCCMVFQRLS
jgi:3-oxoacyl-[acyl-carrier-protein] synthase II